MQGLATRLSLRIQKNLLDGDEGELRHDRLANGLGLAYRQIGESARLTLSRRGVEKITSQEVRIVKRDFTVAVTHSGRSVFSWSTVFEGQDGNHYVVRLAVHFGEQLGLI